MNNMNKMEYRGITAFHPGYYIADIIEDMGVSYEEFAVKLGVPGQTVNDLINGQCGITPDIARTLAAMLGTGAEVWVNLQTVYNQKRAEIEHWERQERIEAAKSLFGILPQDITLEEARAERLGKI